MESLYPDLIDQPSVTLPDGSVLSREEVEDRISKLVAQVGPPNLAYFTAHQERFVETAMRIAPFLEADKRILVAGDWCCFMNAIIEELFGISGSSAFDQKSGRIGYRLSSGGEAWFDRTPSDLEEEPWPAENETFDVVISMEIVEHFTRDPMHFMCEANRVLKHEGRLITTTPNSASLQSIWNILEGNNPFSFGTFSEKKIEHPKEYSPNELALLHNNSGFTTELHSTFSPYGKPELKELREALADQGLRPEQAGQVQLYVGKKSGPPPFRKYGPLYTVTTPFDQPQEKKPDFSSYNHQWWGDCPFVEASENAAVPPKPPEIDAKPPHTQEERIPLSDTWPESLFSESEIQLLKACILPREKAEPLARAWIESVDIDALPNETVKLIPSLYLRLRDWELSDFPQMQKLKGIHRYFWAKNQMLLRNKDQLLQHFADNNIPTLLTKGAALNAQFYQMPEMRPMNDFDFLVAPNKGPQAIQLAEKLGWKIVGRVPLTRNDEDFATYLHALAFQSERDGTYLDIHWHLSMLHLDSRFDHHFWDRSVPIHFGSTGVRTLCPEDMILHTISHQLEYVRLPKISWPLDIVRILEKQEISWDSFLETVRFSDLRLATYLALNFLKREFELDTLIPDSVCNKLKNEIAPKEEREIRQLQKPVPSQSSFQQRFSRNLVYFNRFTGKKPHKYLSQFGPFFRVVNFYDYHPARQWTHNAARHARELCTATKRRLLQWKHRVLPEPGAISNFPPEMLEGFHQLEHFEGMAFRWTEPKCAVRLEIPPAQYEVRIGIAEIRSAEEIQQSMLLRFNSHLITSYRIEAGVLYFPVQADQFAHGVHQTLHIRCEPVEGTKGEDREIGLPVFTIQIVPSASAD